MVLPASACTSALFQTIATVTGRIELIDNRNNNQEWSWNALTSGVGLYLNFGANTATNGQILFEVNSTGSNGSSGATTYAAEIANGHTGTSSTNYGLYGIADNGTTNNFGIYGVTGNGSGVEALATCQSEAGNALCCSVVDMLWSSMG